MRYRSYSYEDYLKTMNMHRGGLGPTEISRKLGIKKDTIKAWIYRGIKPPATRWIPENSKELTYVLGVLHGDGYLYIDKMKHGYGYRIRLGVEDYEFAEAFSRIMAKLLDRKYLLPKWDKSNNIWIVVYSSKAFYIWYKQQKLEMLNPFIEYDKDTVAYFLRGLYDSEGNHYVYKKKYSRIHLSNNDKDLLRYVQHLLKKYFNIHATGPYISTKAGAEHKTRNVKMFKTNYDNYSIYIYRKQHVQRFLSMIGFSIMEKQLGLPRRK